MSGPASYLNWGRQIRNEESRGGYETPVFTDARITGTVVEGYGPFQFLNTVPIDDALGVARPAIVLRVDRFGEFATPDFRRTDETAYHAGWLDDELAAVTSLCLGVRAAAGDRTREFLESDPRGLPCGHGLKTDPVLLPFRGPNVIPSSIGPHNLTLLQPFKDFFRLSPDAATAVVRAARLFQQGLWVVQSDQNLAWLLLTSAIDSAANYWRQVDDAPVDRVRAWRPILADRLAAIGGHEFLKEISEIIAPVTGATKKFLDFLLTFAPEPPQIRPPPSYQIDWTTKGLKAAFNKIYSYRSRALHSGIPFPSPMGWAPHPVGETYAEKQVGSAGTGVHMWSGEDLPLLLHTFEYFVRNALLKWWESLPRNASST